REVAAARARGEGDARARVPGEDADGFPSRVTGGPEHPDLHVQRASSHGHTRVTRPAKRKNPLEPSAPAGRWNLRPSLPRTQAGSPRRARGPRLTRASTAATIALIGWGRTAGRTDMTTRSYVAARACQGVSVFSARRAGTSMEPMSETDTLTRRSLPLTDLSADA